MSESVADTHALYWHLTNNPALSVPARRIFDAVDEGVHRIYVPGIALVEMIYLVERGRLQAGPVERLLARLGSADGSYVVTALDQGTARSMQRVPRSAVPDMPDRIIVATAYQLELPLITRDEKIRSAAIVPVIW